MKHIGEAVLVWGCISASSVEDIVRVDGIMSAESKQISIRHAIPSEKCLIRNGFIFKHGNYPKHTAHSVKSYLASPEARPELKRKAERRLV